MDIKKKIEKLKSNKSYHGCITTLPIDDKRLGNFIEQYEKNGFDDTETWDLFTTITSFVLPRLKRFREILCCYPGGMSAEEWQNILDKMILAFELIDNNEFDNDEEKYKKTREGINLFSEYFFNLWW